MNPLKGVHGNKFVHEMLPTALICQLKAPKVLMQSDMPLCLRSSAKKGNVISVQFGQLSFKHTIVTHLDQSSEFTPDCRLNYRSHGIEMFSDL